MVLSHLDGHLCSDYINASYIDVNPKYKSALDACNRAFGKLMLTPLFLFCFSSQGFKEKSKFIAAQGKYVQWLSFFDIHK